jgi:hypothetical protein
MEHKIFGMRDSKLRLSGASPVVTLCLEVFPERYI